MNVWTVTNNKQVQRKINYLTVTPANLSKHTCGAEVHVYNAIFFCMVKYDKL